MGGSRLAYKLMTEKLWQHAKVLYIATRACWTWYSTQVKQVKSPKDGLREALAMTQGRWQGDSHLSGIVVDALLDQNSLCYMGIEMGPSMLATRLFHLTWCILGHRAWSQAVRHHGPPGCYADFLSSRVADAGRAATKMRTSWATLMRLEQRRLTYLLAQQLWSDIHYAQSSPIRLLHVVFEREQFRASCRPGLHLPLP